MLVKIFVNPSLLEHRLVLQRAKGLVEEEVVRKLPSYINSPDRKKFTCKGMFFKVFLQVNYSSVYKTMENAIFWGGCLFCLFVLNKPCFGLI